MVPPGKGGKVKSIESGDFNVTETVQIDDGTADDAEVAGPNPRPFTEVRPGHPSTGMHSDFVPARQGRRSRNSRSVRVR